MQTFEDTDRTLFNVVLVSTVPCAGEPRRHSEVANAQPLSWERACKWHRDIMTGIGRDWAESRFVDCYIEPVACPRPWSPEIKAAFDREALRGRIADPGRTRAREALAHAALSQMIGTKDADKVLGAGYDGK